MKKTSTFMLLTALAAFILPASSLAQPKAQLRLTDNAKSVTKVSLTKENKGNPVVEKVACEETEQTNRFLPQEVEKRVPARKRAAAEGATCTLNLKLVIPEGYSFDNLRTFSSENLFWVDFPWDDEGNMLTEAQIEIPEGKYDFIAEFSDSNGLPVFIIYELQDVATIDELVFDASQATNCFKVIPCTPEGEVKLDYWELDEEGNFNLIEEGNTFDFTSWLILTCSAENDKCSRTLWYFGNAADPGFNPITDLGIRTNDISDRYLLSISWATTTNDNFYVSAYNSTTVKDATINIDPNTFQLSNFQFAETPANEQFTSEYPIVYHIVNRFFLNGWDVTTMGYSSDYVKTENLYFNPSPDFDFTKLPVGISPDGKAISRVEEVWGYPDLVSYSVTATPTFYCNDDWFTPVSFTTGSTTTAANSSGDFYKFLAPDSRFSFYEKNNKLTRGNTAPYAQIWFENYEFAPGTINGCFVPTYFGYMNEERSIDKLLTTFEIRHNGEVVASSENGDSATNFPWDYGSKAHSRGVYEYSFLNKNVSVDGISGYNELYSKADWDTGDLNSPMITRLTFKDKEGNINDRYEKGEDGMLTFAAADFIYVFDIERYWGWYDKVERPANVTVQYSPYGRDNWKALECKEIPEEYDVTLGYVYEVSLADVDKASANGWFDVRIEMTDEAGNVNRQTLSPAFCVKSLTGVDTAAAASREVSAIYDMNGHRLNQPCLGINIVVYTDGTTEKLFRTK